MSDTLPVISNHIELMVVSKLSEVRVKLSNTCIIFLNPCSFCEMNTHTGFPLHSTGLFPEHKNIWGCNQLSLLNKINILLGE